MRTPLMAFMVLALGCGPGPQGGPSDDTSSGSTSIYTSSTSDPAPDAGSIDECSAAEISYVSEPKALCTDDGTFCVYRALELVLEDEYTIEVIGDVDHDGFADLVRAGRNHSKLEIWYGASRCGFSRRVTSLVDGDSRDLLLVDLDLDGQDDLLRAGLVGEVPEHELRVELLRTRQDGTLDVQASAKLPNGSPTLAAADIDADGRLEVLYASGSNIGIIFTGAPQWSLVSEINLKGDAGGIGAGDFNDDGYVDIVSNQYYYVDDLTAADDRLLLAGDGKGGFDLSFYFFTSWTSPGYRVATGDFDGNGVTDFVMTGDAVYMDSSGGIKHQQLIDAALFPSAGDVNGDGFDDLINKGVVWLGGPDGLRDALVLTSEPWRQALGDLDQDGIDDIVHIDGDFPGSMLGKRRLQVFLSSPP